MDDGLSDVSESAVGQY